MAPSVGATGIRTRNLALFKDVVPPAFVTNSDCKMATRNDENSQPALRRVGRNSNPLVANVISPAFAKNIKEAARQSGARQFSELSRLRGTGKRTRASRLSPGALPCSPAGIPAASNVLKDQLRFPTQADQLLPRPNSLDVVSNGIRPAKIVSTPARPRPN